MCFSSSPYAHFFAYLPFTSLPLGSFPLHSFCIAYQPEHHYQSAVIQPTSFRVTSFPLRSPVRTPLFPFLFSQRQFSDDSTLCPPSFFVSLCGNLIKIFFPSPLVLTSAHTLFPKTNQNENCPFRNLFPFPLRLPPLEPPQGLLRPVQQPPPLRCLPHHQIPQAPLNPQSKILPPFFPIRPIAF